MAFSADVLANLNNAALKNYIDKGKVWKQSVQNKPMLDAFNRSAGAFSGGKGLTVSLNVKSGQGGGSLQGYSGDDQVTYYNPSGIKSLNYQAKEHHIGIVVTHTELKNDGLDINEDGGRQSTVEVSGREMHALANIFDEKLEDLGEDFAKSLDLLLHQDGSSDPKALAGLQSLVLDNPGVGATGGLSRVAYSWWRNRAATAAYGAAGGRDAIASNPANGGTLIAFLDSEVRQLKRYASGGTRLKWFAGSDFIDAYKLELRANGFSSQSWASPDKGVPDGSIADPKHGGNLIVYDPTLDDMGKGKRCYVLGMGRNAIQLLYFNGKRMQTHRPSRPYDRYTLYNGITTTCVLAARQLNSSGVYDIA